MFCYDAMMCLRKFAGLSLKQSFNMSARTYKGIRQKIEEYQKEKNRCKLYKRIKNYLHDRNMGYCYITDGQIVTDEFCEQVISDFDATYPEWETRYPEWSEPLENDDLDIDEDCEVEELSENETMINLK